MRLLRTNSRFAPPAAQSGVALIVTVIMLAVITFLAVAFLALSGREKGAVKQATDQTTARLAAEAALVRAQNDLLAGMIASRNLANFDFLVSTNFIRWEGFDTSAVNGLTNVNYNYLVSGGALNVNQARQNLANLFYDPRPPVFITNRAAPNSMEFRYYVDLNRNGRADLSGFWGATNNLNQPILDSAGRFVTNFVVGDPQWIGVTDRIELPHSSSNKFVYRIAYAAVPIGKTLDLNFIYNNAKNPGQVNQFLRNQGVGSWEINLAAFLADLNTNYWNTQFAPYNYQTNVGFTSTGLAFDDAYELWNWRRGGVAQASVQALYGAPGVNAFLNDWSDGYSGGLVLNSLQGYLTDPDASRTLNPWSGADMPNHFFTVQDLFDANKTQIPFRDRLAQTGTNASTYDQHTYYRLLSQLGTDSAPDDSFKLNLNYANVPPYSTTNFVRWDAPQVASTFGVPANEADVVFFTNAVDRLLLEYSTQWLIDNPTNYVATFGSDQPIRMGRIPVWVNTASNQWTYTPSVHRLLQVAANIIDARTNRAAAATDLDFPSVFRPHFRVDNGNVYIASFKQVNSADTIIGITPRDLVSSNAAAQVLEDDLIYNVPLVIGAKKGLPNFNEFSMQNVFEITRKLQVTRNSISPSGRPINTNLMYVLGISNALGVELWNSYAATNTRPVEIIVTNWMYGALTNSDRGLYGIWQTNVSSGIRQTLTAWPGHKLQSRPNLSFVVPLNVNMPVVPQSIYNLTTRTFQPPTAGFLATGVGFPQPLWGLNVTNRLQVIMVDTATRRIIDYAHFSTFNCQRDLSEDIRTPDNETDYKALWSTNLLGSGIPFGVFNQINISMGGAGETDTTDWRDYGRSQASGPGKDAEIAYFRQFNSGGALSPWKGMKPPVTNTVAQVPFTPSRIIARAYTWQANDPLVHYLADDLRDFQSEDNWADLTKFKTATNLTEKYLGQLNNRYQPWGGYPLKATEDQNKFNLSVKDPSVSSSDAWNFTTNVFPTLGWLGRVHRGTPWQTIYMKSSNVEIGNWTNWAGNPNIFDAFRTRPVTDRILFDVFTTAFNDNASRGQLPINQTNLAAWSAIFSGVVALTNTSSARPAFSPILIEPAGIYDAITPVAWPAVVRMVDGINRTRANTNLFRQATFQHLGDILAVPELTVGDPSFVPSDADPNQGDWYFTNKSPFLELGGPIAGDSRNPPPPTIWQERSLNDAACEWLPQQVMSLLRLGEPRFVIYAYGQALRPAENSIITSGGQFFGLCTNYQITAEVAARAVVRVEGSADPTQTSTNLPPRKRYPPRLVVESYNYLPPE